LRRRVDNLCSLHAAREETGTPVDVTQLLATVDVVAVFGTVTISRCPADDIDDGGAVDAHQLVVFGLHGGETGWRDWIGTLSQSGTQPGFDLPR
jgi:hypothetical protein